MIRLDTERTKDARDRHEAGVKRLNAIFGLSDEALAMQEAWCARQVARRETPRKVGARRV